VAAAGVYGGRRIARGMKSKKTLQKIDASQRAAAASRAGQAPIIGPGGKPLTRSTPAGDLAGPGSRLAGDPIRPMIPNDVFQVAGTTMRPSRRRR